VQIAYVALIVFYIFICFFLILVVLVQQGKGADIAGAFGGGGTQTAFGARGATTLLHKLTTGAFIGFIVLSLVLTVLQARSRPSVVRGVPQKINAEGVLPAPKPAAPGQPAAGQPAPGQPAAGLAATGQKAPAKPPAAGPPAAKPAAAAAPNPAPAAPAPKK
jgi:preprotein translocase subunit SecG